MLKRFIKFINLSWSWRSFSLLVETNFCIKTITSCQNIRLHSLMCKTILPVIFGIIRGLKISWFSNISKISIVWGTHIKFFNTLFQPMLNHCSKFEDLKVNYCRYDIVKSVYFWGGDTRYKGQQFQEQIIVMHGYFISIQKSISWTPLSLSRIIFVFIVDIAKIYSLKGQFRLRKIKPGICGSQVILL